MILKQNRNFVTKKYQQRATVGHWRTKEDKNESKLLYTDKDSEVHLS